MANFKIGHVKGADGKDGVRGSKWYEGTAITGKSTTATVFSDSGITDALVGDCYLNTNTRFIYKCTTAGDASTAKWEYMTCLSFIDGDEWDASTPYDSVTIVRHNGASYFSLQSSIGQEPSEDSAYWRLIAKDGITPTVDSELSSTSENPVQNKVIKNALDNKSDVVIDKATGKKVKFAIENGIICAREA